MKAKANDAAIRGYQAPVCEWVALEAEGSVLTISNEKFEEEDDEIFG